MRLPRLALIYVVITASLHPSDGAPLSPAAERASFRLADDKLAVELVAAEPEVISPVAVAWDADGRMFVAEMIDYPVGPKTGRVRLLEDQDGDGRYERATVFADELAFPNSVLPWSGGVLVTAAPDLLFLRDTDGDGRADERRVLFTGFGEGNQQLRANGLTWGLDNWIYGANGRSDGDVRRAGDTNAAAVSLRGHDFRFHPRTLAFEPLAGRSQFGVARDDWSNRFLSWNTIPIRHEVFPERYLARNPLLLPATDVVHDMLPPGDTGQVFPTSPAPQTFNSESTSHFNALAGLTLFRGDALGEAYCGNAFVGESLRNLVHRRVLEPDGVTFNAKRAEHGREFLTSTDPWFHPVNFATGPDGALYIVDFYRQWVEHPGYVRGKAREETDWRTGAEHGRIWRVGQASRLSQAPETLPSAVDQITPRRPPLARQDSRDARPTLSRATAAELVALLEHENAWQRDTGQRLLVERQDRSSVPVLAKLARNAAQPVTRLQTLFTLDGLNALDNAAILEAMRDKNPRVREGALRLAEPRLNSTPDLAQAAMSLTNDSDPRMRLQLALSLDSRTAESNLVALAMLAQGGASNRWLSTAILSSVGSNAWTFVQLLVAMDPFGFLHPSTEQALLFERAADLVAATGRESETLPFLSLAAGASSDSPADTSRIALLAGYADGLKRTRRSLRVLRQQPPVAETEVALRINRLFKQAARTATNAVALVSTRLTAIRALASADPETGGRALLELLHRTESDALQTAAARAFVESADATMATTLFNGWGQFTPRARRKILTAALNSPVTIAALVAALDQNTVTPVELDAQTREALRKAARAESRPRLEKVLQAAALEDRREVLARFQPALNMAGDRTRGAELFSRTCLQCHSIQGRGQRVGPDLSGISSRPVETLLADILDPSGAVANDFVAYEILQRDGETLSGLIVSETPSGVTLRRANQPDETVLRTQIQELRAGGKSLMPDGLEAGLTLQDVANLLAFLRQPDAALLSGDR